jgi:hypothetical protein
MNACRSRVADQLADRQAEHMRQIFERNDVDIVGATGQEGAERCPIVFVDNGAGVRRRQAVLPQDRQDVRAAKALITAPSGPGSAPR